MAKQIKTPTAVVKIEKSGNGYNAWDTDGVKRTSEITTGARKRAFEGGYLLGQFTGSTGKTYWRKWEGEVVPSNPTTDLPSVEVPTDHAEVLNFIHGYYSLKPQGLMM